MTSVGRSENVEGFLANSTEVAFPLLFAEPFVGIEEEFEVA